MLNDRSVTKRRTRVGFIEMFKVVKGLENAGLVRNFIKSLITKDWVKDKLFKNSKRNFSFTVQKRFCGCSEPKKHFFSNRIVPHWNKLCENLVGLKTVASLKEALESFNEIGR